MHNQTIIKHTANDNEEMKFSKDDKDINIAERLMPIMPEKKSASRYLASRLQ